MAAFLKSNDYHSMSLVSAPLQHTVLIFLLRT